MYVKRNNIIIYDFLKDFKFLHFIHKFLVSANTWLLLKFLIDINNTSSRNLKPGNIVTILSHGPWFTAAD
jgi:hypothetical protein